MRRLGFRSRIGLFFAALAAGSVALVGVGLWAGFQRGGGDPEGYVVAGTIAGFGIMGLAAAVWLLFDENIAKPIQRLAADFRVRAHADVDAGIDGEALRYLGDLGPAATALSARIGDQAMSAAEHVAAATAQLTAERENLTAILSQVPLAVLLVSEDHRISLYDGQAAHALEPVRPLCLGQSVFGYVDEAQVRRALEGLGPKAGTALTLSTADGTRVFDATLRRLGDGAGYMLSLQCEPDAHAERPLAFDFRVSERPVGKELRAATLDSLTYVIFDTETTGLLPEKDEVVQIGAVRAVGPRLIEGEVFDTLVNPGRPIPPTSTKVHGISDDMVAGAPPMEVAGGRFLQFAEGAVLVAHNAPFDMAFLRRHAEAKGLGLSHPVLDTVLLAAELFGASDGLTLDAIGGRLGVTIPEHLRHTALGDAQATALVFLRMLKVFRERGVSTLGALIDAQAAHSRIVPDLNLR